MTGSAQPSTLRKFGAKLLLVLFGVFFAAVLLEVGLRAYEAVRFRPAETRDGESPPGLWAVYDPDLNYRLAPNHKGHSPEGLKDHSPGPKAGRFRLVILGDSVAADGDGPDDTVVGFLRAELAADVSLQPTSVVNTATPGYTNWQELIYLKKYGLAFEPDLVGVAFCLNDMPRMTRQFMVEDGKILPHMWYRVGERRQTSRNWMVRLGRQSRLLMLLQDQIGIVRQTAEWAALEGFTFDYQRDVRFAWQDDAWQAIEDQLGEMLALGRQHGFRVFVVAFPMPVQYRADYLARDRSYVLKPQRKLGEVTGNLGIPYLDLYGDLSSEMFYDGLHLDPAGRRLAGEKIAAFLKQRELVPRQPGVSGSN